MNLRLLVLLCVIGLVACDFPPRSHRSSRRDSKKLSSRGSSRSRSSGSSRSGGSSRGSSSSRGGGSSRGGDRESGADGTYDGHDYHYSWKHDGGRKYSHGGAVGYCKGLGGGWGPVNIENSGEGSFVNGVISGQKQEYIWTGGVKSGSSWKWTNGKGFKYTNWSRTGGNQRPQPDNRDGNEACMAILNNFYKDGVKWHDVGCSHTKPIICERG